MCFITGVCLCLRRCVGAGKTTLSNALMSSSSKAFLADLQQQRRGAIEQWSNDYVCYWARERLMSSGIITALRDSGIDGAQLCDFIDNEKNERVKQDLHTLFPSLKDRNTFTAELRVLFSKSGYVSTVGGKQTAWSFDVTSDMIDKAAKHAKSPLLCHADSQPSKQAILPAPTKVTVEVIDFAGKPLSRMLLAHSPVSQCW